MTASLGALHDMAVKRATHRPAIGTEGAPTSQRDPIISGLPQGHRKLLAIRPPRMDNDMLYQPAISDGFECRRNCATARLSVSWAEVRVSCWLAAAQPAPCTVLQVDDVTRGAVPRCLLSGTVSVAHNNLGGGSARDAALCRMPRLEESATQSHVHSALR